jgi:membrane protease YdiL (CAAX protease family)
VSSRGHTLSHREALALVGVAIWVTGAAFAGGAGIWSSLGGAAVFVAAAALAFDREARRLLPLPRAGALGLGLAAGLTMAAATSLLYPIVAQVFVRVVRDTADLYTAFGHLPAWLAALLLLPIVVGEEVIWRGLVQGSIAGRIRRAEQQEGPRPPPTRVALAIAVLPMAALYALAMAPTGSPVLVLAAFGGGIVWGALRAHTGNLIAPITAHLVWNGVVLFLRPLV